MFYVGMVGHRYLPILIGNPDAWVNVSEVDDGSDEIKLTDWLASNGEPKTKR